LKEVNAEPENEIRSSVKTMKKKEGTCISLGKSFKLEMLEKLKSFLATGFDFTGVCWRGTLASSNSSLLKDLRDSCTGDEISVRRKMKERKKREEQKRRGMDEEDQRIAMETSISTVCIISCYEIFAFFFLTFPFLFLLYRRVTNECPLASSRRRNEERAQ
jgi:hypothetical protein